MEITSQIIYKTIDITNKVVSYQRDQSICEGTGFLTLTIQGVDDFNFDTWDKITLYEGGHKKGIYYVADYTRGTPDGTYIVNCQDGSKKLQDWFVVDRWNPKGVTTAKYWMTRILNQTGVTYQFNASGNGAILNENTEIGLAPAFDLLVPLLQQSGWYMYFNQNDVLIIDHLSLNSDSFDISVSGSDIVSMRTQLDDKMLRNRAVVWGTTSPLTKQWIFADVFKPSPYTSEVLTVVYANSNIRTVSEAYAIANTLVSELNRLTFIKELNLEGSRNIKIGNQVKVNYPLFNGIGLVTSVGSNMSSSGLITVVTLDERCPRLVGYYSYDGYVYVGTKGHGVYRKPLNGYTWSAFNTGMGNQKVKDLAIDLGLFVATCGDGYAYLRSIGQFTWTKFNPVGFVDNYSGEEGGTPYTAAQVKAVSCSINSLNGDVYITYNKRIGIRRCWLVKLIAGSFTNYSVRQIVDDGGFYQYKVIDSDDNDTHAYIVVSPTEEKDNTFSQALSAGNYNAVQYTIHPARTAGNLSRFSVEHFSNPNTKGLYPGMDYLGTRMTTHGDYIYWMKVGYGWIGRWPYINLHTNRIGVNESQEQIKVASYMLPGDWIPWGASNNTVYYDGGFILKGEGLADVLTPVNYPPGNPNHQPKSFPWGWWAVVTAPFVANGAVSDHNFTLGLNAGGEFWPYGDPLAIVGNEYFTTVLGAHPTIYGGPPLYPRIVDADELRIWSGGDPTTILDLETDAGWSAWYLVGNIVYMNGYFCVLIVAEYIAGSDSVRQPIFVAIGGGTVKTKNLSTNPLATISQQDRDKTFLIGDYDSGRVYFYSPKRRGFYNPLTNAASEEHIVDATWAKTFVANKSTAYRVDTSNRVYRLRDNQLTLPNLASGIGPYRRISPTMDDVSNRIYIYSGSGKIVGVDITQNLPNKIIQTGISDDGINPIHFNNYAWRFFIAHDKICFNTIPFAAIYQDTALNYLVRNDNDDYFTRVLNLGIMQPKIEISQSSPIILFGGPTGIFIWHSSSGNPGSFDRVFLSSGVIATDVRTYDQIGTTPGDTSFHRWLGIARKSIWSGPVSPIEVLYPSLTGRRKIAPTISGGIVHLETTNQGFFENPYFFMSTSGALGSIFWQRNQDTLNNAVGWNQRNDGLPPSNITIIRADDRL